MNSEKLRECAVKVLDSEGKTRGTGFFVSRTGFIITCHHVIADLKRLTIEYDGESYDVEWWSDVSSPERDVAVLKVDVKGMNTPIPDIEPSDFGDEDNFGIAACAFGFPYDKEDTFEGFTIQGTLTSGQRGQIPLRDSQRHAIEALEKKAPWNLLPLPEKVDLHNIEYTEAEPGISGAPVLSSDSGQIVGFVSARDKAERRAYVIKWNNVRFRWGNFPLDPAPPQLPQQEWAVAEALQTPGFLEKVRRIKQVVQELSGQDLELAITLYARDPARVGGIGSFDYDLFYYWNVFDPALMFGPIIQGDERIKITESKRPSEVNPFLPWKEGGFVDREKVQTAAWFKLLEGEWLDGKMDKDDITPDEIRGLLFVNARKPGLTEVLFREHSFAKVLSEIGEAITDVVKKRNEKNNRRALALFHTFRPPNPVDYYANVKRSDQITSNDVVDMFSRIVSAFEAISGNSNLAFTVFVHDSHSNRLNWLWSNGPTSVEASVSLQQLAGCSRSDTPLPVQVALDEGHKPRLIHHLQSNKRYRDCAIITKQGSRAQSNLVVPVLSNYEENGNRELLGIIDIQGIGETEFDTDDVQLIYEFSCRYVSNFIHKVLQSPMAQNTSVTPLLSSLEPFEKKELEFEIHELLQLSFNPMKYLFHWNKIRSIVTGEPVEYPALVEVWPSMKCNHRCDWCRTKDDIDYYRGQKNEAEFMSSKGLQALAQELADRDYVDVLISGGGEPLLHPQIHEFMELAKGIKGTVGIFTNGTRPEDFRFWEHFFDRQRRHSFVRVSLNGHEPVTYYEIHFDSRVRESDVRGDFGRRFAEAKKLIFDLLGMRPGVCTIAIGSTVHSRWLHTVESQARHARQLGVDFIQMRPELFESSKDPERGALVRDQILAQEKFYRDDKRFAVKYTDEERAFSNHDYSTCCAMYLVPTLIPDIQDGWICILPCSYARTGAKTPPILGRMKEGTSLSDFWRTLNLVMRDPTAHHDSDRIRDLRTRPIDPSKGCPQCRYYMLNKRIIEIKRNVANISLITQLVDDLNADPHRIKSSLINDIENVWDASIVNIELAKQAFAIAKRLGIQPSL